MRKEVLIAVVIGLILGGIITFGIYQTNSRSSDSKVESSNPASNSTPDSKLLTILSPEDNDIVSTATASISGTLAADTYLILTTNADDYIIHPHADHSFSQEIKLEAGVNHLVFTAITFDGQREEQSLDLVYSTAEFKQP